MIEGLRGALRFSAMLVVLLGCAAVPALTRIVALGARRPAARVGAHSCRLWCRLNLAILGVRLRVRGPRPRGVFLVASNHVSYLDIFVLGSLYPGTFIAKGEIASWPVFGWIARSAGTLFVNREDPRDLPRVGGQIASALTDGISVTLFAEGGASNGERVHPFMPSLLEPAARNGIECHAASVTYDVPDDPRAPGELICWYDRQKFFPHYKRLIRLRRIEACVTFGERPVRESNRKQLARELHRQVAQGFVPIRQPAYSREASQTSAPKVSHGSRPSSQEAGSVLNGRSTK